MAEYYMTIKRELTRDELLAEIDRDIASVSELYAHFDSIGWPFAYRDELDREMSELHAEREEAAAREQA